MNQENKSIIQTFESRLQNAMLNSNIEELNELLADDLIFTNHVGHLMTKLDDLNLHKSGTLKLKKIELKNLNIRLLNEVALVNTEAIIIGILNNQRSENKFRFSRIWSKKSNDLWQVVMAHSTLIT
ncbi:MAG: nuclear transport factor 2 family protein [Crocosphaera sp.]|nr:nuclear transport factor 2 family protein [Crocosphaera sp.]